MSKKVVKRVSKYNINSNHSLFNYCDTETFKAKNLRNLANYHIRQCFILSSKEEINKEQELYLKDINNAIDKFNEKRDLFFMKRNLLKLKKLS